LLINPQESVYFSQTSHLTQNIVCTQKGILYSYMMVIIYIYMHICCKVKKTKKLTQRKRYKHKDALDVTGPWLYLLCLVAIFIKNSNTCRLELSPVSMSINIRERQRVTGNQCI